MVTSEQAKLKSASKYVECLRRVYNMTNLVEEKMAVLLDTKERATAALEHLRNCLGEHGVDPDSD